MADPDGRLKINTSLSITASSILEDDHSQEKSWEGIEQIMPPRFYSSSSFSSNGDSTGDSLNSDSEHEPFKKEGDASATNAEVNFLEDSSTPTSPLSNGDVKPTAENPTDSSETVNEETSSPQLPEDTSSDNQTRGDGNESLSTANQKSAGSTQGATVLESPTDHAAVSGDAELTASESESDDAIDGPVALLDAEKIVESSPESADDFYDFKPRAEGKQDTPAAPLVEIGKETSTYSPDNENKTNLDGEPSPDDSRDASAHGSSTESTKNETENNARDEPSPELMKDFSEDPSSTDSPDNETKTSGNEVPSADIKSVNFREVSSEAITETETEQATPNVNDESAAETILSEGVASDEASTLLEERNSNVVIGDENATGMPEAKTAEKKSEIQVDASLEEIRVTEDTPHENQQVDLEPNNYEDKADIETMTDEPPKNSPDEDFTLKLAGNSEAKEREKTRNESSIENEDDAASKIIRNQSHQHQIALEVSTNNVGDLSPEHLEGVNPEVSSASAVIEEDLTPSPIDGPEDTTLPQFEKGGCLDEDSPEKGKMEPMEKKEEDPCAAANIHDTTLMVEGADIASKESKEEKDDTLVNETLPQEDRGAELILSSVSAAVAPESTQEQGSNQSTFKPIVIEESDLDDTKSQVSAHDLPNLDTLSADTINESQLPHSENTNLADITVEDNKDDAQDIEVSMTPRAPNPDVRSTDSSQEGQDIVSSSSGDSFSFQPQVEPDGDCEFLDQTLNISAIDTSTLQSTDDTTVDLPVLITSEILDQDNGPTLLNQHTEEDAPGDIMTNESKITSDDSLVLLKIPMSGQDDHAGSLEIASAPSREAQATVLDLVAKSDSVAVTSPPEETAVNTSVESMASFVSAEQSLEGIELIRALSPSPDPVSPQMLAVDEASLQLSINQPKTTPAESSHNLIRDPLLARLSGDKDRENPVSPSAQSADKTVKFSDDNTPIARMRLFPADPDGVVIGKQLDLTLLGDMKKELSSVSRDPARPRVSFAAMHKGSYHDPYAASPVEEEASQNRSTFSVDEARRRRFAAYLKRRMIDYEDDDDEEDERFVPTQHKPSHLPRCQNGIPRVLDPAMCASVESSFTTLVSKADTADDASTIFSAIDNQRKSSKSKYKYRSKYEEDSGSESSYCSESEYSTDDDGRSTGIFPSFFTEADTTRDSQNATLDTIPKWCDNMVLPSVFELEDFLADFVADKRKQVTQGPQALEQKALCEFVDELENEEPLVGEDHGPRPEGKDSAQSVVSYSNTTFKSDAESKRSDGQPDGDAGTVFSSDETQAPEDCGVLTLEDVHELALMAAELLDVGTKTVKPTQPLPLQIKQAKPPLSLKKAQKTGLDVSSDSTEAAWDRVEHTVNDLESVTTGRSAQSKSKRHSRITAKLEHIKKTQPHVYKVFLAKMAAAERSGRKVDLRRDDVVLGSPHSKGDNLKSAKKACFNDKLSASDEDTPDRCGALHMANDNSVQTPSGSVKIQVKAGSPKKKIPSTGASSEWESFDGSPFKEPSTQAAMAAEFMADSTDDSSVLDDFKWLSSAKDSLASTMESFISTPNDFAKPLKSKIAEYSKSNPSFYRILMKKVSERTGSVGVSNPDKSQCDVSVVNQVEESVAIAEMNANEVITTESIEDAEIDGNHVELTEEEFGAQLVKNKATMPRPASDSNLSGAADNSSIPGTPLSPNNNLSERQEALCDDSPKASVGHLSGGIVGEPLPTVSHSNGKPSIMDASPRRRGSASKSQGGVGNALRRRGSGSKSQYVNVDDSAPIGQQNNDIASRMGKALRRRGSATRSHDGSIAVLSGSKESSELNGDSKTSVARKIEFFAKNSKSQTAAPALQGDKKVGSFPKDMSQPDRAEAPVSVAKNVESFPIAPIPSTRKIESPAQKIVPQSIQPIASTFADKKGDSFKTKVNPQPITHETSAQSEQVMGKQEKRDVAATKHVKGPQSPRSALHQSADRELQTRFRKSSQPKQDWVAPRSKTPLSSNRSGTALQEKSSKYEQTRTPRSSNRSVKQLRPEIIKKVSSSSSVTPIDKKIPTIVKPDTDTALMTKNKIPEKQSLGAVTKVSTPDSATPSQWETFEESTFQDFVMQSFGRGAPGQRSNQKSQKEPARKSLPTSSEPQDSLPRINLEASFLDSILPAPPSFHDKGDTHQQKDPWDFSEAAGEQWEHFSPTSFPTSFTKWGLNERPTSAPKKNNARKGPARKSAPKRSSPSSIAEF